MEKENERETTALTPHHPVYEQQLPSPNPQQVYPSTPPQVPSGEVMWAAVGVGLAVMVDVVNPDLESELELPASPCTLFEDTAFSTVVYSLEGDTVCCPTG